MSWASINEQDRQIMKLWVKSNKPCHYLLHNITAHMIYDSCFSFTLCGGGTSATMNGRLVGMPKSLTSLHDCTQFKRDMYCVRCNANRHTSYKLEYIRISLHIVPSHFLELIHVITTNGCSLPLFYYSI